MGIPYYFSYIIKNHPHIFQMFNKSQQNPSMSSHTGGLNDRISNYYNYNNYKNTLEYTPLYAESSCSK